MGERIKKPILKYVCLSDLHLGEEDSLLTNLYRKQYKTDPENPSPVMIHFKNCLSQIITNSEGFPEKKPTLIILGDGLDLALSYVNDAAMVFERFLETFFFEVPEPLFKEIIYIPGNHDHHIWETAREIQYAEFIKRHPETIEIPIPWQKSKAIPQKETDFIKSPLLESCIFRVMQRENSSFQIPIKILYPNFIHYDSQRNKFIIFHHGHFFEKLYYLMSWLKIIIFPEEISEFPPKKINNIEAENFAWIDFFWSTLGRSGEVGEKIEIIWEMLQSKKGKEKLIENFAKGLAKKIDIPNVPTDWLEEKVLKFIIESIASYITEKLEKRVKDADLSEDFYKLLKNYLRNAIFYQIKDELKIDSKTIENSEIILIFGHTHKPLKKIEKIAPYKNWIKLYNTGGWVCDKPKLDPIYGSMIIFIDEESDVAGLKLFSLGKNEKPYPVEIYSSEDKPSNLYQWLSKFKYDEEIWINFNTVVQMAAQIRAAHLKEKYG